MADRVTVARPARVGRAASVDEQDRYDGAGQAPVARVPRMAGLRPITAPFVAPGPSGVTIRPKGLTAEDEQVLRLVGLGSSAGVGVQAYMHREVRPDMRRLLAQEAHVSLPPRCFGRAGRLR
jgi:hypothetical protein